MGLNCANSPDAVYRFINISGGRIELGNRFVQSAISNQVDDTTYELRPGTFGGGGTRSILVSTSSQGIVRSMRFTYDGTEPVAVKVRDYMKSLGPPREHFELAEGDEVWVWKDQNTRFELHHDPSKVSGFWSRLLDLTGS